MMLWRLLRHRFGRNQARRFFPSSTLKRIQKVIAENEKRHMGEIVFVVENALPVMALWTRQSAAARAREVFAELNVWDTQHNTGVLIYLLLADRRVEIVADRGIHACVGNSVWEKICTDMLACFAKDEFEAGAILGIEAISCLLIRYFPADEAIGNANELSDTPIVL